MIFGRRVSTEPMRCSCGWRGELRQAVHGYTRGLDGDSEISSTCPVCGEEVTSVPFGDLLPTHRPVLLRIATRMVRNSSAAEDLVQEALMRAWKSQAQYRRECSLRTWLTRILLNVVYEQQRRWESRIARNSVEVCEWHAVASGESLFESAYLDELRRFADSVVPKLSLKLQSAYAQVLRGEIPTKRGEKTRKHRLMLKLSRAVERRRAAAQTQPAMTGKAA